MRCCVVDAWRACACGCDSLHFGWSEHAPMKRVLVKNVCDGPVRNQLEAGASSEKDL